MQFAVGLSYVIYLDLWVLFRLTFIFINHSTPTEMIGTCRFLELITYASFEFMIFKIYQYMASLLFTND